MSGPETIIFTHRGAKVVHEPPGQHETNYDTYPVYDPEGQCVDVAENEEDAVRYCIEIVEGPEIRKLAQESFRKLRIPESDPLFRQVVDAALEAHIWAILAKRPGADEDGGES